MDQAAEGNFVTENPETSPRPSSEGTEVRDSNENVVDVVPDIPVNYMKNKTENPKPVPGSSTEEITTLMDSNENVLDVPDIQSHYVKNKIENPETFRGLSSEGITEFMDSNENVVDIVPDVQSKYTKIENPETVPGSSSGITEVMDSSENVVDVVSNIQSKYPKNKTGNRKSKIQNDETKEMTVAYVPERKIVKRKAAHPPTSEMVMDSIKALKKRNGASFADIRKYIEEKYVVDMKFLKHHVDKFLQKSVDNGVLEKIESGRAEGSFKIRKSENPKEDSKNLSRKEGKVKPGKKMVQQNKKDETKEMTVASVPERKSLKRKAAHPPTSEMVMDSIKALKKRNGASFADIRKYTEEKYVVNMKLLKYHVDKFLQKSVDNGVLEKIESGCAEGRFKIKESENRKKDSMKLPRKEGKVKPEKKMAATKKQVKK